MEKSVGIVKKINDPVIELNDHVCVANTKMSLWRGQQKIKITLHVYVDHFVFYFEKV